MIKPAADSDADRQRGRATTFSELPTGYVRGRQRAVTRGANARTGCENMNDNATQSPIDSVSRRTVLKRSAAAAGALGVGSAAVGGAAGQDDSPAGMRAMMYLDQVYPLARFQVISPSLDWTPPFESLPDGVQRPVGENYDTRLIRYQNTNERVLFFPRTDVQIDRSETYALTNARGFADDDTDEQIENVVQVRFSPASEVSFPDEGDQTTAGNETTTTDGG